MQQDLTSLEGKDKTAGMKAEGGLLTRTRCICIFQALGKRKDNRVPRELPSQKTAMRNGAAAGKNHWIICFILNGYKFVFQKLEDEARYPGRYLNATLNCISLFAFPAIRNGVAFTNISHMCFQDTIISNNPLFNRLSLSGKHCTQECNVHLEIHALWGPKHASLACTHSSLNCIHK